MGIIDIVRVKNQIKIMRNQGNKTGINNFPVSMNNDDIFALDLYINLTNVFIDKIKPKVPLKELIIIFKDVRVELPIIFGNKYFNDDGKIKRNIILNNTKKIKDDKIKHLYRAFAFLNTYLIDLYSDHTSKACAISKFNESYGLIKEEFVSNKFFEIFIKSLPYGVAEEDKMKLLNEQDKRTVFKQRTVDYIESYDKYKTLFQYIDDTIFLYDSDYRIVDINPPGCKLFGSKKSEIIGKSLKEMKLFQPGSETKFIKQSLRLLRSETKSLNDIYKVKINNGPTRILEISSMGLPREGNIPLVVNICHDITKRIKMEEALRESEQKYKGIFNNVNDTIIYVDKFGKIVEVNQRVEKVFGYPRAELLSKDFMEFNVISEKDLIRTLELFNKAIEMEEVKDSSGKGINIMEIEINRKDGSIGHIETSTSVVKTKGKLEGFITIIRDITSRKKAEESLEKYKILFSQINDLAYICDLNGNILFLNEVFEKLSGHKTEESIGKSFAPLYDSKNLQIAERDYSRTLDGELRQFEATFKDTGIICEYKDIPMRDETGEIIGMLGIGRDITERKIAEEILKQKTHDLRERVKELNCLNIISQYNLREEITLDSYLNDLVDHIPPGWQYPEITCCQIIFEDKVYRSRNFQETEWVQRSEIITNGERSGTVEVYYLEEKPEEHEGVFLKEERNLLNSISMIIGNYVERKHAEELRQEFVSIIESSDDGIISNDINGYIISWNKGAERIYGYSGKDVKGKPFSILDPKNTEEEIPGVLVTKNDDKSINSIETIHQKKNGKLIYVSLTISPLKDSNKNLTGTSIIARDITEQKKAVEALRESEERLRRIFESSPDGITVTDMNGIILDCNNESANIYGSKSTKDLIGKNPFDLLSENEHQKIRKSMQRLMEHGIIRNIDYVIIKKDGQEIPCELSASLIYDAESKPSGFVACTKDITERKSAEKMLFTSAKQWQTTFDSINDAVLLLNADGEILRYNNAMKEFVGNRPNDIIGKKCYEINHNRKKPIEDCPIKRAQKSHHRENLVIHENDRWFNITIDPIIDDSGTFTGCVHIREDITERRIMEENIKQALSEKEILYGELKHRVKNNLQLLISMVDMQIKRVNNQLISSNLLEVKSFIETMALIYSKTFEDIRIMSCNLNDFINEMIKGFMKFSLVEDLKVDYTIAGDNIRLGTHQAMPLAFIINEFIFNSLKHAFVGRNEGHILIHLKEENDIITITLSDDGIGIPTNINTNKPDSLGLRLVNTLSKQLKAKIAIVSDNGTKYILEIKKGVNSNDHK